MWLRKHPITFSVLVQILFLQNVQCGEKAIISYKMILHEFKNNYLQL